MAQTASMAARSSNRFCFFSFALLDFLCNRERQSWLQGLWPTKTCLSLCGTEGSVSTGLASAARTSSPSCCTLAGVGKIQARSSRETLGVSPTAQLPCQEEYRPLGQLGHCEDPVRLRDDACSRAQPEWVPNKYSPPHPPLRREQLILDTIGASFREEMASEVAADSCS